MAARRDRYTVSRIPEAGTRRVRCEDMTPPCEAHMFGWRTTLHVSDKDRLAQVQGSGRHYTHAVEGAHVVFTFPPGQQCFRGYDPADPSHRVDVRQLFLVPQRRSRELVTTTPQLWIEQFGENQQKLAEIQARG